MATRTRTRWIAAAVKALLLLVLFVLPAKSIQTENSKASSKASRKAMPSAQVKAGAIASQVKIVPNLIGLRPDDARQKLMEADLTVGAMEMKDPSGVVISQDPPPGPKPVSVAQVNLVVALPQVTVRIEKGPEEPKYSIVATANLQPQIEGGWYIFTWGDHTPDTSQSSSTAPHTYGEPKPTTVIVVVRVAGMILPPASAPVTFAPEIEEPQYAVDLVRSADIGAGETALFVATLNREPPPGQNVEYCFDWKDDSDQICRTVRSSNLSIEHPYGKPGDYEVVVSVSVNGGPKITGLTHLHVSARADTTTANQDAAKTDEGPSSRPDYQLSLSPETIQAETGQVITFTADLKSSGPLPQNIKYCFFWGDKNPTCQIAPSVPHAFTSGGTYLVFVEVIVNGQKVVSQQSTVEVSRPLWIKAVLLIVISLIALYGVSRIVPTNPPHTPTPSVPGLQILPKQGVSHLEIVHPELVKTKLLIRVRWVRPPATVKMYPTEKIIKKKKETAHG